MDRRLELHDELLQFIPKAYFQPPSDIQMVYPCIVYTKIEKSVKHANDTRYLSMQGYQLMLIERVPDSNKADDIEGYFQNCSISQYYTADNLYHTTIELYY
jgi:hypothetical protein